MAFQVIRKRWLLSILIFAIMVLTLINTTAALGLLMSLGDERQQQIVNDDRDELFYTPELTSEAKGWLESQKNWRILGVTPYWQGYGISLNRDDFTFYPSKVVEYGPSWHLVMVSGRKPIGPNEMMINTAVAAAMAIEVGDQITVSGYDRKTPFTVVGIIEDPLYRVRPLSHTRFFVSELTSEESQGVALAISFKDGVNHEALSSAFQTKFGKPFLAEKLSVEKELRMKLEGIAMVFIVALMIWLVQFLLIILIMAQVMYYLVTAYPGSQIASRSTRFDHLDVYLNYSMLLILAAFVVSSFVVGAYIEMLSSGTLETVVPVTGLELATIHLMSLGFWMTVFVLINWILQRFFRIKPRGKAPSKQGLRSQKRLVDRAYEKLFFKRLLFILIANTLVGFLLIVSIESGAWSQHLATVPSLWGFPNTPVSLNSTITSDREGFSFESVVLEGPNSQEARAVISESGFEKFGIVLVAGRLPKWTNEIIVGVGLANEGYGVGSTLRFYDKSGWHSGLVVGIGNALFDKGRIFGYCKAAEKTFVFGVETDDEIIDFSAHVKRHFLLLRSNLAAYMLSFTNSVLLIGILTVGIFYAHIESLLLVLRRHILVLRISWLKTTFGLIVFASCMSALSFALARLFWQLVPSALFESISLKLGLVPSSIMSWAPESLAVLPILFVLNFVLAFGILVQGFKHRLRVF